MKREFVKQGGYFLSPAESDAVAKVLLGPQRLPNPALVGRPATVIAQAAGITVPPDTRVLIAELKGVGRDYPLSIEKLCPVLSFYIVARLARGVRALQSRSCATAAWVTRCRSTRATTRSFCEFGLKKPAGRICVNTPTTHGSIGLTTGLDPAMTLGLRRLGRQHHVRQHLAAPPAQHQAAGLRDHAGGRPQAEPRRHATGAAPSLPQAAGAVRRNPAGLPRTSWRRRIDEFLGSRGYRAPAAGPSRRQLQHRVSGVRTAHSSSRRTASTARPV